MTTLDEICNLLMIGNNLIEGYQFTPTNIRLTMREKEFVEYLSTINQLHASFRFMEKRLFNILDVHLYLELNDLPLNLTLRVVDPTILSFNSVKTCFPNAAIFIEEIKEIEGS